MANTKNHQTVAKSLPAEQQLKKDALVHVVLGMQENVLVTHEHLRKLRECAETIQSQDNLKLYIVSERNNPQVKFLIKTLIHLGISCGQIHCLFNANNDAPHIEIFVAA